MEMKFTPGPWTVDVARDIRYIHSAAGDIILQFSPLYDGIDNAAAKNECDANARLIAAAPDLLAALQEIVREPQGKTVADNAKVLSAVIRIARAALAKAGGQS